MLNFVEQFKGEKRCIFTGKVQSCSYEKTQRLLKTYTNPNWQNGNSFLPNNELKF